MHSAPCCASARTRASALIGALPKMQAALYEEKLKKSAERSQAPMHKKTGKQVMFRSRPAKRRVKKKVTEEDNAELEERKYFE